MNKEKGKIYQIVENLSVEKNVHISKMILNKLGKSEDDVYYCESCLGVFLQKDIEHYAAFVRYGDKQGLKVFAHSRECLQEYFDKVSVYAKDCIIICGDNRIISHKTH